MRPGAPGPAPTSQTQPGSKTGKGSASRRAKPVAPSRVSTQCSTDFVGPDAIASLIQWADAIREARRRVKARLDDGRMRNRGSEGSICGIAQRQVPGSGHHHACPRAKRPSFALALEELGDGWARAGIVKDAGDDPDVTHGAWWSSPSGWEDPGIRFFAGEGVGIGDPRGIADSAGASPQSIPCLAR